MTETECDNSANSIEMPFSNTQRWLFSGIYPFNDKNLPEDLSKSLNRPLFSPSENEPDVIGIILPYPHGFDYDKYMYLSHTAEEFLHIFNTGRERDNVIGVSRGVRYETGVLPSMKRVSMRLV